MNLDDFRILSKDCAKLFVADYGVSAVVKICGRATFVSSVHFKKLFNNLISQGCEKFTLDLSDCQLMDSTFLGVLVGLSRNFSNSADSIFLFNSAARRPPEKNKMTIFYLIVFVLFDIKNNFDLLMDLCLVLNSIDHFFFLLYNNVL